MAPQVESVSLEEQQQQQFSQSAHPSNDFPVAVWGSCFPSFPLSCSDCGFDVQSPQSEKRKKDKAKQFIWLIGSGKRTQIGRQPQAVRLAGTVVVVVCRLFGPARAMQ